MWDDESGRKDVGKKKGKKSLGVRLGRCRWEEGRSEPGTQIKGCQTGTPGRGQ